MAAQPLVRRSIERPLETVAINVLGTANLLDILRGHDNLSAVLVVTSDKVYANSNQSRRFIESDPLGGKDPYSGSKAACEIVTNSFAQTYFVRKGVPIATARGGNVIGGGDFAIDRIIPDAFRAVERNEPIVLRHPDATRPWQHVLDCIAGYLVYIEVLSANRELVPLALNIGPDESVGAITVGELVENFQRCLGCKVGWNYEPVVSSIEMKSLQIDARLARSTLGWGDRLPGMRAVKATAEWYQQYLGGANPRQITLEQIARYENLR